MLTTGKLKQEHKLFLMHLDLVRGFLKFTYNSEVQTKDYVMLALLHMFIALA